MIEPTAVAAWLELPNQPEPGDHVTRCTQAVNAFVEALPSKPTTTDPDTGQTVWAPQTVLAATMLAARLVRRRNSPAGVEGFTDTGAVYVSRYDPDVGLMLRMGSHAAPMVG